MTAKTSGRFPLRWIRGELLQRFGMLIFFLIVLGPLAVLIAGLVSSLIHGHGEWLLLAIPTGRRLGLLVNSISFAAAVAAAGLVLGTLGSSILWQWDAGWRSYLRWLVIVLAPLPPYIHALVWTSTIYAINSMLQRFGLFTIPVHGWIVCWWIQLMSLAPIAVGLSLAGLKSVEPAMIDAARMMRSDLFSFSRVMLPLAGSTLLAGGGVLFLLSLMDYSVPSLLNLNVYALEIFAEFSASNEPVRALLLSLPLLIIAVIAALASFATLKNAAQISTWRVPVWKIAPVWPAWFVCLQRIAITVLAVQIGLPLLILTTSVGTWSNLWSTIISAGNEIVFSFWIDILVALFSIPIALSAATGLVRAGKRKSLLWILIIAPLAIPPPLIGIGMITVWNKPLFSGVYGSSLMPVLAGLARFAPLAVIVLAAQLRRIDPILIDAARILQPGHWKLWKRIWLPMLMPGILAAAGIAFALTTGELGATLLVAPPGKATLTMRIYNFLHYGATDAVAGLCLMMTVITVATGVIVAISLRGGSNRFPKIAMRRK